MGGRGTSRQGPAMDDIEDLLHGFADLLEILRLMGEFDHAVLAACVDEKPRRTGTRKFSRISGA